MRARITTVSRETVLLPVHAWRLISRLLPPRCRYYPSCSAYCLEAVRSRGIIVGLLLSTWRVVRCNPWSLGGVDPVPPRRSGRRHACSDATAASAGASSAPQIPDNANDLGSHT